MSIDVAFVGGPYSGTTRAVGTDELNGVPMWIDAPGGRYDRRTKDNFASGVPWTYVDLRYEWVDADNRPS